MNIERNLLSLGLAALLAACSADDSRLGTSSSGRSVFIASATLSNPATRATGTSVVIEKGSMGLYRSKGTGYTSTLNNLTYTYSPDAGWQPATPADTLLLNGDNADVCAYYPYNADVKYADPTSIPLQSGKYVGSADVHDPADLCYDINRAVNAYQRSTTFALEHAMALLEIEIYVNSGFKGDGNLSGITLQNPELIAQSSINITNRTYSTSPVKGSVAFPFSGTAMTNPTVAALLVPFTPSTEGVTVVLTMDNIPYTANIPTADAPAFVAGMRYGVKVEFNGTKFQVTNVSRLPWIESGVGGDDYAYYPVEKKTDYEITLGMEVTIGDYTWATANLCTSDEGASNFAFEKKPWTSGVYPGEVIADGITAPEKTDPCYWNWGCLATLSTTVVSADIPVPNNTEWPSSVNNTYGDPCTKIAGGEWQLPSVAQYTNLMTFLPQISKTVAVNGEKWTVMNTNGIVMNESGNCYGQLFVEGTNVLFLPAAGKRHEGGSMYDMGIWGAYWTRSAIDNTNIGNAFQFSMKNMNYFNFHDEPRLYGLPVRCVKGSSAP